MNNNEKSWLNATKEYTSKSLKYQNAVNNNTAVLVKVLYKQQDIVYPDSNPDVFKMAIQFQALNSKNKMWLREKRKNVVP